MLNREDLIMGETSAVREPGDLTLAAYAYDGLGRRRRLTRGNGVLTNYTPDAASRLAGQRARRSAAPAEWLIPGN